MCFDGTADFAALYPTHVFRLFRSLERSDRQLIYYAGGVGTLKNSSILSPIKKAIYQTLDLAAGFSIRETFVEAMQFLARTYRDGDELYFFGFSRGSYAARAVAAGINYFGIPEPEHENMIPYIWEWFSENGFDDAPEDQDPDDDTNIFRRFGRLKGALTIERKESFIDDDGHKKKRAMQQVRRNPGIRFMGIWDTVSSFGIIRLRTLPGTSKLEEVQTLRHAISIDEKRNMFPENRCSPDHPDLKEVWFAGVHRDVGGGGAKEKRGLSMIPYDWMVKEAVACGLLIDKSKVDKQRPEADPVGPMNDSLAIVLIYAIAGLVPMRMWDENKGDTGGFATKWLNFVHVRPIPKGAYIHASVATRIKHGPSRYRPKNVKLGDVEILDDPVKDDEP